jgi:hypothetical protein
VEKGAEVLTIQAAAASHRGESRESPRLLVPNGDRSPYSPCPNQPPGVPRPA